MIYLITFTTYIKYISYNHIYYLLYDTFKFISVYCLMIVNDYKFEVNPMLYMIILMNTQRIQHITKHVFNMYYIIVF